jgi:hypothetical protein
LEHTAFTFGIITKATEYSGLESVVNSILTQTGIEIEVLIVGGSLGHCELPSNVRHIPFDEDVKNGWITRKKNIVAQSSSHENLVICHDYLEFRPGWSQGFLRFGFDWDVAMTRVSDVKGRRFYDWVTWDHPTLPRYSPVDYENHSASRYLFVPGAYWVAKKSFMLRYPLNESLSWGESEDVEWTLRIRPFEYKMNPYSEVRHVKKHRGYKWWKAIY